MTEDGERARAGGWDDLGAQAEALRLQGCSVPEIAERLGISRSSAYRWVGHLPLVRDEATERARRSARSAATAERWVARRAARDAARAETVAACAGFVKRLRYRDLVLVGAAIYWSEGTKAKPWRPNDCRVRFVNSDPVLVELFVSFVEALGVPRATLRYRVSIHETADPADAVRWWAAAVGVPPEDFKPTTLKRHNPTTRRRNTGEGYHGCLAVDVPRSSRMYWKIEGIMKGMADGVAAMER
ncbi:helix-turn-helix domain-containing protein [Micromonospora fluostatini]|uniref:helix-turn-helix domain-containing protein n=1 Tax=Micromonospora sp. JCM 30529 TaxID=3421643 RepID=UPI003D16953F